MTTAQKLPATTSHRSLHGKRVLVVQVRPSSALGIGAAVARAGARVSICRTTHAALDLLASGRAQFDAAVLDGELDRIDLIKIGAALRHARQPALAIGVASLTDPSSIRRLVEAGVMELVVPPLSPAAVIDALGRCVVATVEKRQEIAANAVTRCGTHAAEETRRPVHWGPTSGIVPRHNPDIEHAVARYAKTASLSPREIAVLKYIALGYRYDEIGEALSISGRTVKMHAANVRRKVGAPDRLALVRKVLAV